MNFPKSIEDLNKKVDQLTALKGELTDQREANWLSSEKTVSTINAKIAQGLDQELRLALSQMIYYASYNRKLDYNIIPSDYQESFKKLEIYFGAILNIHTKIGKVDVELQRVTRDLYEAAFNLVRGIEK